MDFIFELRSFFHLLQAFGVLVLLCLCSLAWCWAKVVDHEGDVAVELRWLLKHALALAVQVVRRRRSLGEAELRGEQLLVALIFLFLRSFLRRSRMSLGTLDLPLLRCSGMLSQELELLFSAEDLVLEVVWCDRHRELLVVR